MDKTSIYNFMQEHYSDERLAALLAHARDGKLSFSSCCCFVGAATSDHAMKPVNRWTIIKLLLTSEANFGANSHYRIAKRMYGAENAEQDFHRLGKNDKQRRRILIPMIRAEMKRREKLRQQLEWKQELVEMST